MSPSGLARWGRRVYPVTAMLMMLGVQGCVQTVNPTERSDLHSDLLTLDTHLDTPVHFARPGWDFGDRHDLSSDVVQLDIPRMIEGHLDGGFFVIFTDQGELDDAGYAAALDHALQRSGEIDAMLESHSDQIRLALTADDAVGLTKEGRLIAFKSMENSYPFGLDLSLAETFYNQGLRMAGPVHSTTNQFADSSNDAPMYGGLSDLGRDWVVEMNRLGILIDGSHASDAAFDDMIELSETPLILSHTSPRAFFDHPRNLDDDRIRELAETGGAICVSAVYLSPMNMTDARAVLWDEMDSLPNMTPEGQVDFATRWQALNQSDPMWADDFERFMEALLHVIDVAGVDHVCIGADWDGGGGFKGLEDITDLPKITTRLQGEGYSKTDIEKIWSGNILRLLSDAQEAKK